MYTYRAKIISVYDGDTVTAIVDLGFGITNKVKVRLKGINAPEVRGEQKVYGIAAREFLKNEVLNKNIVIQTFKDKKGKYGRYIGVLWVDDLNINELLVEQGHAETREY
jgi:micrococcal nuclease